MGGREWGKEGACKMITSVNFSLYLLYWSPFLYMFEIFHKFSKEIKKEVYFQKLLCRNPKVPSRYSGIWNTYHQPADGSENLHSPLSQAEFPCPSLECPVYWHWFFSLRKEEGVLKKYKQVQEVEDYVFKWILSLSFILSGGWNTGHLSEPRELELESRRENALLTLCCSF